MTQVEIIALIVTFVGVISFATIITLLYHSYISSSIKDIKLGKQDADLIDEVIKDGSEQRQKRKKVMTIVKNSLFCVFLAIIIPVFALAIISKVNGNMMMIGGNSIIVVASGSMSTKHPSNDYLDKYHLDNQFQTYDIIGLSEVDSKDDLKVHDVIAFRNDKGMNVIHRIISFEDRADGKRYYTTRGDSNNASDTFKPTFENVLGKYNGKRIPIVGMFVLFFQSPSGIITALAVVYCLFMIDHLSNKMAKVADERLEILSQIFDIDNMSEEDIEIMKIDYVEYILYKGNMYRINETGIIDKVAVDENYGDKKILELVENSDLEESQN